MLGTVHLPQQLKKILPIIETQGLSGKVFVVGGLVRDSLLGRSPGPDVDIVVEGDALSLCNSIVQEGLTRGDAQVYPRFGTCSFYLDDLHVEMVAARSESYQSDSRKPDVEPATLHADGERRDFTINTLLADIATGQVHDILGTGLADLNQRILRTPLDPVQTFLDDPLRMLRAVRFANTIPELSYAPGLVVAIEQQAHRLSIVSPERIYGEVRRMLLLGKASNAFREMESFGLLEQFGPDLCKMKGVDQGGLHHLDVWEHSLLVLQNIAESSETLRWAALLHDIGKPVTKTMDPDGRTRFFNHQVVGAEMAIQFLRNLTVSESVIGNVALLIREHMRLTNVTELSDSGARRIVRDLGESLGEFFLLIKADRAALREGSSLQDIAVLESRVREVAVKTSYQQMVSPLTGTEIMALTGLDPGPEVGELKERLLHLALDGELEFGDKHSAVASLKENWKKWVRKS